MTFEARVHTHLARDAVFRNIVALFHWPIEFLHAPKCEDLVVLLHMASSYSLVSTFISPVTTGFTHHSRVLI
jgi:hypothetical protein